VGGAKLGVGGEVEVVGGETEKITKLFAGQNAVSH